MGAVDGGLSLRAFKGTLCRRMIFIFNSELLRKITSFHDTYQETRSWVEG